MKRSLMVFSAIAAFALPALAPVATLAQDRGQDDSAPTPRRDGGHRNDSNGDRQRTAPDNTAERSESGDRGGRGPDRGGHRGERPDRPSAPASQPNPPQRPDRPDRPGQGEGRPDRPAGGWNNGGPGRPDRPSNGGTNRPDRPGQGRPDQGRPDQGRPDQGRPGNGGWNGNQGRPDRPGQDRPGQGRPDQGRPGNGGWNGNQGRPGGNSGWNNNDNRGGRDRDRQRQEYRSRFDSNRWQQSWDRTHRSDWWRNDNRFRGWNGARIGFYFAPGYGYYSVPRNYYGQTFHEGQYLPSIFWRYSVNDYRTYGLGFPPEGTRWVYVDNSIYLIDQYDGYIIDVIRSAWRW
ncbi:MAG TPA: RcnB family protein [Brevundimonas sp.]|jgi:Ni/Co efflux regulator RcnB